MEVIKTKGGYFYKIYKNGKKKRISKNEYLKHKKKLKLSIKQYGGDITYQFKPDLFNEICENFNIKEVDRELVRFALKNFSILISLTDWEDNKKFLRNKGIEGINENIPANIISKCSSYNITENQNNSSCIANTNCNTYFSASRGRKKCVPKNSIKNFTNKQGIMSFNNNKFKIIKIIKLSLPFVGERNCIILQEISSKNYFIIFPFGTIHGIGNYEEMLENINQIIETLPPTSKIFLCGHSMGSALAMQVSLEETFLQRAGNVYLILTGVMLYFNSDELTQFKEAYKGRYIALNIRLYLDMIRVYYLNTKRTRYTSQIFKDFRSVEVYQNRHTDINNNFILELQVKQYNENEPDLIKNGKLLTNRNETQKSYKEFLPDTKKRNVFGIILYNVEDTNNKNIKYETNRSLTKLQGYLPDKIHTFDNYLKPIITML
jgi:hypothetical protein